MEYERVWERQDRQAVGDRDTGVHVGMTSSLALRGWYGLLQLLAMRSSLDALLGLMPLVERDCVGTVDMVDVGECRQGDCGRW